MMPDEQLWHNLSTLIHVDVKSEKQFVIFVKIIMMMIIIITTSSSARKLKRVERQSATAISVLTASACDATE